MAVRKKKILPGALVEVSFPIENEQTNNPARKFEGQQFVVKEKHLITSTSKPQYTLYGAEVNGLPYWFLEDELMVLSEVTSWH